MEPIHCDRGQPLGPPPPGVIQAASDALLEGCSDYTHPLGLLSLRQAISAQLRRELGVAYDPEHEIIVIHGASAALMACIQAFTLPDRFIWIPTPGWPGFSRLVRGAGRRAAYFPYARVEARDSSWRWESLPTERGTGTPQLLLLDTPHNPTGRLLDASWIARLEQLTERTPALTIVSDETYADLVYDGRRHRSPACSPVLRRHTVVVRSFSKSHAMAGWRVGYLAGPRVLVRRLRALLEPGHGCASTVSQRAALWLLEQGKATTTALRDRHQARRDLLVDLIEDLPGMEIEPPEAGLYLFPRTQHDDVALTRALAEEQRLHVYGGQRFGPEAAGHLRILFAKPPDTLREVARRLRSQLDPTDPAR